MADLRGGKEIKRSERAPVLNPDGTVSLFEGRFDRFFRGYGNKVIKGKGLEMDTFLKYFGHGVRLNDGRFSRDLYDHFGELYYRECIPENMRLFSTESRLEEFAVYRLDDQGCDIGLFARIESDERSDNVRLFLGQYYINNSMNVVFTDEPVAFGFAFMYEVLRATGLISGSNPSFYSLVEPRIKSRPFIHHLDNFLREMT